MSPSLMYRRTQSMKTISKGSCQWRVRWWKDHGLVWKRQKMLKSGEGTLMRRDFHQLQRYEFYDDCSVDLHYFRTLSLTNLYSLTFAIQWHMQTCMRPILCKLDIITNFLKAASSAVIYIMRGAFLYHSHCFNASLNFFPRLCYNWKMFLSKKVSNS